MKKEYDLTIENEKEVNIGPCERCVVVDCKERGSVESCLTREDVK